VNLHDVVAVLGIALALPPALIGLFVLFGLPSADRQGARLATLHSIVVIAAVAVIRWLWARQPGAAVELVFDPVVRLGEWALRPVILIDRLSLTWGALIAVVYPVIVRFSLPSFDHEPGAPRYWFLVVLCATALLDIAFAGSIDVLYIGWELVGVSSVMLIAFFRSSVRANENSLRALIAYRVGDASILGAAVFIHHGFPDARFIHFAADAALPGATGIAIALWIGSLAKSAQLPMSPWLHRAMEGPAASSGIFYGALSVHLGPFLLLRTAPLWSPHDEVRVLAVVVGLLTAAYASLVERTRCDAKTTLAYATMTQVGVIFVEIGLGLHTLALVHAFAHAGLRTWQFLRSSSLIQDFQDNPLYGRTDTRPPLPVRLLPTSMQRSLWLAAMRQFWLDGAQQAFVARPVVAVFGAIAAFEDRVLSPGVAPDETSPRARVAVVVLVVASAALWLGQDPRLIALSWAVAVFAIGAAAQRTSPALIVPGVAGLLLVALPAGVANDVLPTWLRALLLGVVAGVVPVHLWLEELRRRVPAPVFIVFLVAQPGTALVWHVITSLPPPPAVADVFAILGVTGAVAHAGLALVRKTASRALAGIAWSQRSMILTGLASGAHGTDAARLMVVACLLGSLVLLGGDLHLRRRFSVDALAPDNGLAPRAPMLTAAMLVSGWIFVGLPGGLTFFAEDLLFSALFEQSPWLALALVVASGVNAIAFYRVVIGLFGGVARPTIPRVRADVRVERALMMLTIVALAAGLWPGLIAGHH